MNIKTWLGIAIGLLPGLLSAQDESQSMPVVPEANCQEAVTEFMDASRFSRRGGGAKNMNETHARYNSKGWKFEDMEIYVENGDLEGFFLTYTRDITCGQLGPGD